jgi:hypothetical protein
MVGCQLLVQCSIHLGGLSFLHQEKSLLVEKAPMSSIGFPVLKEGPWSVGQGGSPLTMGQRFLGANQLVLELGVAKIHLQESLRFVLVTA